MIKNIPKSAKKIAEKIKENKGQPVAIQSKDIVDSADGNITSNEVMVARRSIMFASDVPIIAEKQRTSGTGKKAGSRSTAYFRALTPEEFKRHEFVQENFQRLTHENINMIINRILQVRPETDMTGLLQYLVICDIIIQYKGDGRFVSVSRNVVACSLMQTKEKVEGLISNLIQAGIVSRFHSKLRFNSVFEDVKLEEDSTEGKTADDMINEVLSGKSQAESKFQNCLRVALREYNNKADRVEVLQIRLNDVTEKLERLQKSYAKIKAQSDGFTMSVSAYKKQSKAYKALEEQCNAQKKSIERYHDILKKGFERRETHMETFTQGILKAVMDYETDNKKGKFITAVNALTADLNRGMEDAYPSR